MTVRHSEHCTEVDTMDRVTHEVEKYWLCASDCGSRTRVLAVLRQYYDQCDCWRMREEVCAACKNALPILEAANA